MSVRISLTNFEANQLYSLVDGTLMGRPDEDDELNDALQTIKSKLLAAEKS